MLFHLFVVGFNFYTDKGVGFFAPFAVPTLPHTGKILWTCRPAFSFILDFNFYTDMGVGFFAPFAVPTLPHTGKIFWTCCPAFVYFRF